MTTPGSIRHTITEVTSDTVIERISKLRAVTVERGATAHEAATAGALADRLAARAGLDRPPAPGAQRSLPSPQRVGHPQVAHYARNARTDRRSPGALRFVAFG